mmetsp:Transcript_4152/g.16108  ORF Transcript_4152/g.16108 Transcript_4152/m.16108 type:complete len:2006 (-) Transcript_4152:241-6258(-)
MDDVEDLQVAFVADDAQQGDYLDALTAIGARISEASSAGSVAGTAPADSVATEGDEVEAKASEAGGDDASNGAANRTFDQYFEAPELDDYYDLVESNPARPAASSAATGDAASNGPARRRRSRKSKQTEQAAQDHEAAATQPAGGTSLILRKENGDTPVGFLKLGVSIPAPLPFRLEPDDKDECLLAAGVPPEGLNACPGLRNDAILYSVNDVELAPQGALHAQDALDLIQELSQESSRGDTTPTKFNLMFRVPIDMNTTIRRGRPGERPEAHAFESREEMAQYLRTLVVADMQDLPEGSVFRNARQPPLALCEHFLEYSDWNLHGARQLYRSTLADFGELLQRERFSDAMPDAGLSRGAGAAGDSQAEEELSSVTSKLSFTEGEEPGEIASQIDAHADVGPDANGTSEPPIGAFDLGGGKGSWQELFPRFEGDDTAACSDSTAAPQAGSAMENGDTSGVPMPVGPGEYDVVLRSDKLGMTVENVLERTVVRSVIQDGAAQRAGILEGSLLVRLGTHSTAAMSHFETIEHLKQVKRPLNLRLRKMPPERLERRRSEMSALLQFARPTPPPALAERIRKRQEARGFKYAADSDETSGTSWTESYASGILGTARRLGERASSRLMSLRRKNSEEDRRSDGTTPPASTSGFRFRFPSARGRSPVFAEDEMHRLINLEWAEERLMNLLRMLAVASLAEAGAAEDQARQENGVVPNGGMRDVGSNETPASIADDGAAAALPFAPERALDAPAEDVVPQEAAVPRPRGEEPLEVLLLHHGPPDSTLSINERLSRIKATLRKLVDVLDFDGSWVKEALRDLREPLCLLLDVDRDFVLFEGEGKSQPQKDGREATPAGEKAADAAASVNAPVRRLFLNMAFSLDVDERAVEVVPLVHRLATSSSVCARMLCSSLIPDLYMSLPLPQQLQLRGVVTRFIYDKVPLVRKCATQALGKFASRSDATAVPWLLLLLERCADDAEAEVREKAIDVVLAYSICLPYAMLRLSRSLLSIASGRVNLARMVALTGLDTGDRSSPGADTDTDTDTDADAYASAEAKADADADAEANAEANAEASAEEKKGGATTSKPARRKRLSASTAFGALADVGLELGTQSVAVYRREVHLLRCKLLPVATTLAEDISWAVRAAVAKKCHILCGSLGGHWSAVVIDLLAALLEDRASKVRACAITNLPSLAGMLSKFAMDENGDVDEDKLQAGRMKLMQALLPPAAKIASDRQIGVRSALARCLVRLASGNERGEFGASEGAMQEVDEAIVPLLRKQLLDEDAQVRTAAVMSLAARPIRQLGREERTYVPQWEAFAEIAGLELAKCPRVDLRSDTALGADLGSEIGLGPGLGPSFGVGFNPFPEFCAGDNGKDLFQALQEEDKIWKTFLEGLPETALAVPTRLSRRATLEMLDVIHQLGQASAWRTRVHCAAALPSCGWAAFEDAELSTQIKDLLLALLSDRVERVRRKAAEALALVALSQPYKAPPQRYWKALADFVASLREAASINRRPAEDAPEEAPSPSAEPNGPEPREEEEEDADKAAKPEASGDQALDKLESDEKTAIAPSAEQAPEPDVNVSGDLLEETKKEGDDDGGLLAHGGEDEGVTEEVRHHGQDAGDKVEQASMPKEGASGGAATSDGAFNPDDDSHIGDVSSLPSSAAASEGSVERFLVPQDASAQDLQEQPTMASADSQEQQPPQNPLAGDCVASPFSEGASGAQGTEGGEADEEWNVRDSLAGLPPPVDAVDMGTVQPPSEPSTPGDSHNDLSPSRASFSTSALYQVLQEVRTGAWLWDVFLPVLVFLFWHPKSKHRLSALHATAVSFASGLASVREAATSSAVEEVSQIAEALGGMALNTEGDVASLESVLRAAAEDGTAGTKPRVGVADILASAAAERSSDTVVNVRIAFLKLVCFCGPTVGKRRRVCISASASASVLRLMLSFHSSRRALCREVLGQPRGRDASRRRCHGPRSGGGSLGGCEACELGSVPHCSDFRTEGLRDRGSAEMTHGG